MSAIPVAATEADVFLRLRQQELVAAFGIYALQPRSVGETLEEACRTVSDGLGTRYAKVLRYRQETNDFLIEAGVGWHAGVVGHSTLGGELDSPAGFALKSGQPTVAPDLLNEGRFRVPAILAEHGVLSALNVPIAARGLAAWGVLEVDSTRRHEFMGADTSFVQSVANVLEAALERSQIEAVKDQALRDKDLLMQEVHHRVKNSLQLVKTMLGLQGRGATDQVRAELEVAAQRIMSIAAVHQRLYEGGSVAEGDAAAYVRGLLTDMQPMFEDAGGRSATLEGGSIPLSADRLTSLGLIVSELVTNALKHGRGRIVVRLVDERGPVRVEVEDEGDGFDPEAGLGRLGMRLVHALAKGERVRVDRDAGVSRVAVVLK